MFVLPAHVNMGVSASGRIHRRLCTRLSDASARLVLLVNIVASIFARQVAHQPTRVGLTVHANHKEMAFTTARCIVTVRSAGLANAATKTKMNVPLHRLVRTTVPVEIPMGASSVTVIHHGLGIRAP
jgi:hypothetical protein